LIRTTGTPRRGSQTPAPWQSRSLTPAAHPYARTSVSLSSLMSTMPCKRRLRVVVPQAASPVPAIQLPPTHVKLIPSNRRPVDILPDSWPIALRISPFLPVRALRARSMIHLERILGLDVDRCHLAILFKVAIDYSRTFLFPFFSSKERSDMLLDAYVSQRIFRPFSSSLQIRYVSRRRDFSITRNLVAEGV
jgi:hypothetical protein